MGKFIGKWQMTCLQMNGIGGWQTLKSYANGNYVLVFHSDCELTEIVFDESPIEARYHYDPARRILTIKYAENEERFRVEWISDKYCLLYDLEGVEVEPDDYCLKMEMEKF